MNVREIFDNDFGRVVMLENGYVEIGVMVDAGPRVIHFALAGGENVMYRDCRKAALGEQLAVYGDIHRLYGGHRLWAAPEVLPRCYHPDNLAVEWHLGGGAVVFAAQIEEHSRLQKILEISVTGHLISVSHRIKNCGLWDIELAPWAITMLAPGGIARMPLGGEGGGLLPAGRLVFWDYTDLADPRLTFDKNCAIIKQADDKPLKIGTFAKKGIHYTLPWANFHKFVEPDEFIDGEYPDFGCNYEIYTDKNMLEAESLGALRMVAPGNEVVHTEIWELTEV